MSATRLLVLGVVRMYGSAHGYQVRRELLSWSADKWGNVQPGSIYHALKKMTSEGLLAQVHEDQPSGGPDRVAYRLTDDGEHEFMSLLRRALSGADEDQYSTAAGVTLMTTLPRRKAISLLRMQLVAMEAQLKASHYAAEHVDALVEVGKPPHTSELYRLWSLHAEANTDWMRSMIDRLEAGEYVMSGEGERAFGEPAQ